VVGDIKDWKTLGLLPNSFDVIAAFEVVEQELKILQPTAQWGKFKK